MSDDRSGGHRRRSGEASVRADELRVLRDRLLRGEKLTADDLEQAVRHLDDAVRRAEEAHERAALAHRRSAETHRRAAALAEGIGDAVGAARHRQAALEADRAAVQELVDARDEPSEGEPSA